MNVDAVLCTQALKKGRDVSIAFTGYGKAFESLAHSWLIKDPSNRTKARVTAGGHVEHNPACK